jgi:hypothetical protein
VAIPYWLYSGTFNIVPMLFGVVAAIFDNIGMNSHITAFKHGPAGPISAIISISNIFTAVI